MVVVQSVWRGRQVRRRLALHLARGELEAGRERLGGQVALLARVEVIQRWWRRVQVRRAASRRRDSALLGPSPSLGLVVEHMHLLYGREEDFQGELKLSKVRGELSKFIRSDEQLENKVDQMDVRIGWQEEAGRGRARGAMVGTQRGLKALKKESHDKLVAYQHRLYLPQTDPTYLARLMFAMPASPRPPSSSSRTSSPSTTLGSTPGRRRTSCV